MELALDGDESAVGPGDADLVGLLLDNLLGNALKHAAAGGGAEVGVHRGRETVRPAVRDHGPGIPEEARERVLERFYRPGAAASPGSGLGLAIAARATRRLEAALRFGTPAHGEGLEVELTFPAVAPPASGPAEGLAAGRGASGRATRAA